MIFRDAQEKLKVSLSTALNEIADLKKENKKLYEKYLDAQNLVEQSDYSQGGKIPDDVIERIEAKFQEALLQKDLEIQRFEDRLKDGDL